MKPKETDAFKLHNSKKNKLPENITKKKLGCVQSGLMHTANWGKQKDSLYENDTLDTLKYAAQFGTATAIRKFKHRFPNSNESTMQPGL